MALGMDNGQPYDPLAQSRGTSSGVVLPEPISTNNPNVYSNNAPYLTYPSPDSQPYAPKKRERVRVTASGAPQYVTNTQRGYLNFSLLNQQDDGTWVWSSGIGDSSGTSVPVVLFGDANGQPFAKTNYNKELAPLTLDQFHQNILNQYNSKEGGITSLKKMLINANFITGKNAQTMLSNGDMQDPFLNTALNLALLQGTAENAAIAKRGGTKFNSFSDWIKNARASSVWGTAGAGGTPSRQVSISRQKFRPEEFDIAIDNLFQQTIGRGATGDEVKQFIGMLNSYQNAHPQKTVSVTHGNTTTSTTSGGVNQAVAEQKMKDLAMQNPDAENYNKATKYLDYFKAAIAAPVQLG
jgi:hypothetical protein